MQVLHALAGKVGGLSGGVLGAVPEPHDPGKEGRQAAGRPHPVLVLGARQPEGQPAPEAAAACAPARTVPDEPACALYAAPTHTSACDAVKAGRADIASRVNVGQTEFKRYPENLLNSRVRYGRAFQVRPQDAGHSARPGRAAWAFTAALKPGVEAPRAPRGVIRPMIYQIVVIRPMV